jgi:hypothetical protein
MSGIAFGAGLENILSKIFWRFDYEESDNGACIGAVCGGVSVGGGAAAGKTCFRQLGDQCVGASLGALPASR